jgi:hypothetical protein
MYPLVYTISCWYRIDYNEECQAKLGKDNERKPGKKIKMLQFCATSYPIAVHASPAISRAF